MAYVILQRGLEGQSGYYARVKRKRDNYWWDEIASGWIATITANCDLALTESSTGVYDGSAGLTPSPGGVYIIYVYDSSDALLFITEDVYQPPYDKTVIQMIKDVQIELRMPQSSLVTAAHAALILGFLNRVMRDFVPEAYVWDELGVKGSIMTVADVAVYPFAPANAGDMDIIRHLQIGTNLPLVHRSDEEFHGFMRENTSTAQPLIYRHYSRAAGIILVEFGATPDDAYQVDYEGLEKPARLVAATDVPMLDPDVLILGGIMLARKEAGLDYAGDLNAFEAKLGMAGGAQGESNWGDVKPV